MRISDWSSDVCSSDLSTGRTGKPSEWKTRHAMHKRILIVDDEPAIREMVAFALRKGEYEPAHAGDAREAQESIANRVPDLILLEIGSASRRERGCQYVEIQVVAVS